MGFGDSLSPTDRLSLTALVISVLAGILTILLSMYNTYINNTKQGYLLLDEYRTDEKLRLAKWLIDKSFDGCEVPMPSWGFKDKTLRVDMRILKSFMVSQCLELRDTPDWETAFVYRECLFALFNYLLKVVSYKKSWMIQGAAFDEIERSYGEHLAPYFQDINNHFNMPMIVTFLKDYTNGDDDWAMLTDSLETVAIRVKLINKKLTKIASSAHVSQLMHSVAVPKNIKEIYDTLKHMESTVENASSKHVNVLEDVKKPVDTENQSFNDDHV